MVNKKRKQALTALDGFIDLPSDQRRSLSAFQGRKVRIVARMPNGNIKVQLLEDINPNYRKGRQITLLSKSFVKDYPVGK